MGEGAKKPEARCHSESNVVDATDGWDECHAPYPGRSAVLRKLASLEGDAMGRQKSAEGVVAEANPRRPEHGKVVCVLSVRHDGDAELKAEMPEPEGRG